MMDLERIIDTTIMAVESLVYALGIVLFATGVWVLLLMIGGGQ